MLVKQIYETLILNTWSVDRPTASFALIVKEKLPPALGALDTRPIADRVMPGGRAPADTKKVIGFFQERFSVVVNSRTPLWIR